MVVEKPLGIISIAAQARARLERSAAGWLRPVRVSMPEHVVSSARRWSSFSAEIARISIASKQMPSRSSCRIKPGRSVPSGLRRGLGLRGANAATTSLVTR